MAVYFKHTHTVTQQIPYQFTCEQCKQDSGMLAAEFKAEATRSLMTKRPLTEEEKTQLHQEATESLHKAIQHARQNATEESFSELFKDKCPHCGKPQSWMLKGMQHLPGSYAIVGAVLSGLLCLAINLLGIVSFSFGRGMLVVLFCALAGTVIGFIRVGTRKAQTKSVQQKQTPRIFWSDETAE